MTDPTPADPDAGPVSVAAREARHEAALADPFFGELARTHPDVDVVLLPPRDPRPPAAPDSAEEAARLADRVVATAHEVGEVLGLPAQAATQRWWRTGDRGRHRHVVRARFAAADPADAENRTRRLARHLLDDGWDAGAVPEPQWRLTATRGPVRLALTMSGAGLALRVESCDLHLTDDVVCALTPPPTPPTDPTTGAAR